MKKKLFTLLLGSSLLLAACGGNNSTSKNELPVDESILDKSEAATIYKNKCLSCHGDTSKDIFGPGLANVGSKLSEEEILHIIENGQKGEKGEMPAGLIKDEEAEKMAQWLSTKK